MAAQPPGDLPAEPAAGPPGYSLAYERFVRSEDDTVGLLAYALYKSSVRQEAMQGQPAGPNPRAPVPAMVEIYRQAAEQRISQVITGAIAQATPDIQASSAVSAIASAQEASVQAVKTVEQNMKVYFDQKTSFSQAMLTSFTGWLLTLGVTAIIIFLAGRTSVEDMVKKAVSHPVEQAQGGAPGQQLENGQ